MISLQQIEQWCAEGHGGYVMPRSAAYKLVKEAYLQGLEDAAALIHMTATRCVDGSRVQAYLASGAIAIRALGADHA